MKSIKINVYLILIVHNKIVHILITVIFLCKNTEHKIKSSYTSSRFYNLIKYLM